MHLKERRDTFSTNRSRQNIFLAFWAQWSQPVRGPAALTQSLVHLHATTGGRGLRTVSLLNAGSPSPCSFLWQKAGFPLRLLPDHWHYLSLCQRPPEAMRATMGSPPGDCWCCLSPGKSEVSSACHLFSLKHATEGPASTLCYGILTRVPVSSNLSGYGKIRESCTRIPALSITWRNQSCGL